jgi:hypothetical protein
MTALQALAMASGAKEGSSLGSVILLRRTGPGQAIAERLDLAAALKGDRGARDVLLAPNDILYVPPTFITKLDRFVDQFFFKLNPVPRLYLSGWEAFHTDRYYGTVVKTQASP